MTNTVDSSTADSTPAPSSWSRIWSAGQIVLCFAIALGVLVYLLIPSSGQDDSVGAVPQKNEVVQVVGPSRIRVAPGSALANKIQSQVVYRVPFSAPALKVTGSVVASLRPGNSPLGQIESATALIAGQAIGLQIGSVHEAQIQAMAGLVGGTALVWQALAANNADFWQFNAPEVLTAFTDWQKAIADIAFSEKQLISIRDLARDREQSQQRVVEQMRVLVKGGTESQKNLALEETNLRQYHIQGRKEIHEAESAVKVARRNEAALARQLQQAGLDPELLRAVTSDVDIVMAEVPEGKLTRVQVGKSCTASFFGIPGQVFAGKVKSIAPLVTKERRTLRVLFTVDDLNDQLRPGMFAEIGLDTEPRAMLLMPSDGVLHVGRADYALVDAGNGEWHVVEVVVGEFYASQVEILSGLQSGARVMGKGAILLKPLIVEALQEGNGQRPTEGGDR